MKFISFSLILLSLLIAPIWSSASGWIAYNDCVFEQGVQILKKNVTTFGLGRGCPFPQKGDLVNFADGKAIGATVEFVEHKTQGSINWAKDNATFNDGSDAAKIFNDIVDPSGNMSYGDAPDWHLDLIFSGLEANGLYTFVGTVNRGGGDAYGERTTNWTIMEADDYTYASSAKAHKISDDSVEFSTGENTGGLIARWTEISPDPDGKFMIRTSHGVGGENGGLADAHDYKGYAGGMFMLEYQGVLSVDPNGKVTTTWAKIKRN